VLTVHSPTDLRTRSLRIKCVCIYSHPNRIVKMIMVTWTYGKFLWQQTLWHKSEGVHHWINMRKERAEGLKDHINKNRKKGNGECSKKNHISVTYRINNCFCRTTEKEKGTLNQAPVTILWSNKMGLVAISFRHNSSNILHWEMFVQRKLLQCCWKLVVKNRVDLFTPRSPVEGKIED